MKIRALIVDDEPLARQRIRLLAADEPGLEFIGECANGHDALDAIHRDPPDLLFLDVQMPEMDGFQLLQKLPCERLPVVIFTTAYDQHAVRAFDAHALDYLLKPFKPERFKAAIARAREHLANQQACIAARSLLDLLAERQSYLRISSDRQDLKLVVGDDYLLWSSAFPGPDLADPDADLDGDGMSNDEERIFGLNPDNGASVNPIATPLNAAADTFSYTRRTRNLSGRTFSIWTSPDLVVWTRDSGAVQTPDAAVDDIGTVSVTLSPPLLTAPRLFVQVRATP